MKLYVTRHGQTDWNVAHKVCGISNGVLTEEGIMQAKGLERELSLNKEEYNIKHIFASPLERAQVTASFCAKALDLPVVLDKRLEEQNFGIFEGVDWDDPEFNKAKSNPYGAYPKGESVLQVAHRAYSFIEEVKALTNGENALVVCHGTFARILSTYFVYYSVEEYKSLRWQNCELRCFDL